MIWLHYMVHEQRIDSILVTKDVYSATNVTIMLIMLISVLIIVKWMNFQLEVHSKYKWHSNGIETGMNINIDIWSEAYLSSATKFAVYYGLNLV